MSGPKGGGYSVETAQAREARELAAAVAGYEQTRSEMERLRGEARAARAVLGREVGVPAPLPPARRTGRTSSAVAAADAAARQRVRDARDALTAVTERLGRERWQARLAQVPVDGRSLSPVTWASDSTSPASTASTAPTEVWRTTAAEQLATIAAGWPAGEPTTVLDRAAEALPLARSSSAAALLVSRAGDEVARLRARRRAEEALHIGRERLRAQVESVREWHDDEVAASVLAEVDASDPSASVVTSVERFVAQAHARRDRTEAGAILADVLTELGYRLGEGFATRLSGDADVLVGHDRWTDHAVSVRLDAEGRAFTHLVRSAEAEADDDVRADTAFCADFDTITARSAARGLQWHSVRRHPPGRRALRTVEADKVRAVASSRRSAGDRERSR